jgi:hypothetical protein
MPEEVVLLSTAVKPLSAPYEEKRIMHNSLVKHGHRDDSSLVFGKKKLLDLQEIPSLKAFEDSIAYTVQYSRS